MVRAVVAMVAEGCVLTGVCGLEGTVAAAATVTAVDAKAALAIRKLCTFRLRVCKTDLRLPSSPPTAELSDVLRPPPCSVDSAGSSPPWFMNVVWIDESDNPLGRKVRSNSVSLTTSLSSSSSAVLLSLRRGGDAGTSRSIMASTTLDKALRDAVPFPIVFAVAAVSPSNLATEEKCLNVLDLPTVTLLVLWLAVRAEGRFAVDGR